MRKLINIFKGLFNFLNPFNEKFLCSDWLKEKELFDRNYHHYVLTEHCRTRMKERRIIYRDLNLAFKYGKLIGNQILLDISHIPDECFQGLNNKQIKHILGHLPLVITIFKVSIMASLAKNPDKIATEHSHEPKPSG